MFTVQVLLLPDESVPSAATLELSEKFNKKPFVPYAAIEEDLYFLGCHTPVSSLYSPKADGVNAVPSIKFTSVIYPS